MHGGNKQQAKQKRLRKHLAVAGRRGRGVGNFGVARTFECNESRTGADYNWGREGACALWIRAKYSGGGFVVSGLSRAQREGLRVEGGSGFRRNIRELGLLIPGGTRSSGSLPKSKNRMKSLSGAEISIQNYKTPRTSGASPSYSRQSKNATLGSTTPPPSICPGCLQVTSSILPCSRWSNHDECSRQCL